MTQSTNPLDRIRIERHWAMPSKHTFSIKPIDRLLVRVVQSMRSRHGEMPVVDPFCCGNRRFADITNDLDPSVEADYHEDAIDFLRRFDNGTVAGVLFDPPYSPRQVSESYRRLGRSVNMETTQASYWSKLKSEIGRIVAPKGLCVTCGWNSGGIGRSNGFAIAEILLVPHGGWHNDTICVVEDKVDDCK